ncbi:MAG TPA: hypothetical protein VKU82_08445 [Planctomycetaceae bacterium]|nr:hypothetical protein [Planctomycetaceae bacterium]
MPVFRVFLSIVILGGVLRLGVAGEPNARELVAPGTALLVEVNRPTQLIDNPLARDVWGLISETNGVKQALSSPEVDRFRQAARFVEKSLGVDWRTGIDRLTSGGIVVAIGPKRPDSEPVVTAIVTASDEQILKQFIDAVQAEIRRAANPPGAPADKPGESAPERKSPETASTEYRSFACQRVGNGHFSVVGRRLIVSNAKSGLEAALDRLAGAATDKPFDPPQSLRMVDGAGKPPAILATVNLKFIRSEPNAQAALTLPANDPLPVLFLGGYVDLVRRADFAAAGLFVDGPAHELKIRFPVGTEGAYQGLRGYFASETTEAAPPLLRPPGTIFTAGWFRDYKKLWDARSELLNSELVAKLDADNAKAQSEGPKIGVADVVQIVGPHFRVVAAQQQESVYKIKVEERLPAFALVVSVRDEGAFRQRIAPAIDSLLWLGLASSNLGEVKPVEYRGAKINAVRFTEKPEFANSDKSTLYNFDPAYTLTRGQLIVGSTSEIVRHLIDELERQPAPPSAGMPERATEHQELSLAGLGELLKVYQSRLTRAAVLHQGLSPAEADQEIDSLYQVLKRLGDLTSRNLISADHFEIDVRLGPAAEKP